MKKAIGLLVVLSTMFVLVGCGSSDAASEEEMKQTKDAGKTESARGETTQKPTGNGSMPPATGAPEMNDLKK